MRVIIHNSVLIVLILVPVSCSLDVLTPRQITIEAPAVQAPENKLSSDLPIVVVDFEDVRNLPQNKVGHYYYFLADNPCHLPDFAGIVTQAFKDGLSSMGASVREVPGEPPLLLGGEIFDFYILYAERPGDFVDTVKQYFGLCQYLEIHVRLVDLNDGGIIWEDTIVGNITSSDLKKALKWSWTLGGSMEKITRRSIEHAVTNLMNDDEFFRTLERLGRERSVPNIWDKSALTDQKTSIFEKEHHEGNPYNMVVFCSEIGKTVSEEEWGNITYADAPISLDDVKDMLTRLASVCSHQGRHVEAERYENWAHQVEEMIREGRGKERNWFLRILGLGSDNQMKNK